MNSPRRSEPTLPEPSSDVTARSKGGTLLMLMVPFIVGSLYLVFTVTLWIAPDSMRGGDRVYSFCFIGGVAFGGLTAAFVWQWLWRWYPQACFHAGLVAWTLIGIGIAILKLTK